MFKSHADAARLVIKNVYRYLLAYAQMVLGEKIPTVQWEAVLSGTKWYIIIIKRWFAKSESTF